MEFRNEAHRMEYRRAFTGVMASGCWSILAQMAEEVIRQMEQKCLLEDDEEKAKTYRWDARGARRFWQQWVRTMNLISNGEDVKAEFLDVVMD